MLIPIYPTNPDEKKIKEIINYLNDGQVIILPTDGVYAFACSMEKNRGIESMAKLKGIKPEKANFTFVFHTLSQLAAYTKQVDTTTYKLLKRNLPGAFTFILPANNAIPKVFKNKKTIGIRIPDNAICLHITEMLGCPLLVSSVHDDDDVVEYTTDPELIHERYEYQVAAVINGGYGTNIPSTIVDCTGIEPEIIREGLGILA